MKLPELLVVSLALAVCGADEEAGGGPADQEVSETGHRKARFWRKLFKSLYSNGPSLAYPAAYLIGNYAKHLGHGLHHHKGHLDYGYGSGHHGSHPYGGWGGPGHHDLPLPPPLHNSYPAFSGGIGHYIGHDDVTGLEFGPGHHNHHLEGLGLYPEGGWGASAWHGYGWGDHSLLHDGFWD